MPEKLDITELVNEEIKKFQSFIVEKKLKITKDYQDIKEIFIDRKKITVVINSLLSNSVHYSSPGGSIKISLGFLDDRLLVTVQDSGWGIPKNQQDKIFSKLFRADNVAKKDAYGIGLSLYICKNIINKLNGKIWFESEEDKGTVFHVEFPAQREITKK